MYNEQISGRTMAQRVDKFNMLVLMNTLLIILLFSKNIPNWTHSFADISITLTLYAFLIFLIAFIVSEKYNTVAHILLVVALYSHLFQVVSPLQHIIFPGWFDQQTLFAEDMLWGGEISVLMQPLVTPVLTEWLMFAYVFYVPMIPLIGILCYFKAGKFAAENYLYDFARTCTVCYGGFILFPLATPLFYQPDVYDIPLTGGIFTYCGEWIRSNQHFPGGGLPSPHAAVGTFMLLYVRRYIPRLFMPTLILVLSIYMATVYCRYHYIWDTLAGISAALVVFKYHPSKNGFADRLLSLFKVSDLRVPSSINIINRRTKS